MTNITYYIIATVKIFVNLCKKRKSNLAFARANTQFMFERRYAQVGATIMLAFTYGFAMPLLFVYCFTGILIITLFDKLLITYWERPRFLMTDRLNYWFNLLLKVFASLTFVTFIMIIYYNASLFGM